MLLALMLASLNPSQTPLPRTGPLSLAEVLASAEALFPSLVAARSEVDAAEGELQAANGIFDPSLRARAWVVPISGYPQTRIDAAVEVPTPLWGTSLFAGYRLGAGLIQDYYGERTTWTGGELRAGAAIPLLRNGPIDRRRASIRRAELGHQLAGQGVEQQRIEITRLASSRYWDWVAAGHRREIAGTLLKIAQRRDEQLSARASAGDVPLFEQKDNQRALMQRQALWVQAQRGLEQAALELSLFVRDDEAKPSLVHEARLPAALPDPDDGLVPSFDLDLAVERRPEVQRLSGQMKQQDVELGFLRNQLLPALDFTATVSQDVGRSPGAKYDPLGKTEVEFSLLLDVPLLYRGPLGRLRAAQAVTSKLEAQLKLARERVLLEATDALSAIHAAQLRVALIRQEIELATQLEQGEQTRFELGESNLLFVNLREQASAEARLREVDALLDFHKAVAALKAAASSAAR